MVHRLCRILLPLALAGCDPMDRASVLVAPTRPVAAESPFPALNAEPGIRRTFDQYAKGNGYACHPNPARIGRTVCRGPRDLHVTFAPRTNGEGYVVAFSWVRSGERSEQEFRRQVAGLERALAATGASIDVRLGELAE